MARGSIAGDADILRMALVGYEAEKEKLDGRIRELESQLRGKRIASSSGGAAATVSSPAKRNMSPEARNRISAAQRKRWAEHRKRKAAEARAGRAG